MPQLPPVAAAAFVGCLLVVIVATAVIVRVRSRRRGVRLAEMVRTTAPVPRPATSRIAQPPPATAAPVRGRWYRSAEEFGRFVVFAERPGRDPAPGRPARRLAAQLAYAAAPSAVAAPPPSPAPVVPARPRVVLPPIALARASHAGLAEVLLDLTAPGEREMRAGPSGGGPRPATPDQAAPWLVEPLAEDLVAQSPWLVEPAAVEPAAVEPAAVEPAAVEPAAVEPAVVEPSVAEPAVMAESPVAEPSMAEPVAVAEPSMVEPAVMAESPVAEPPAVEPAVVEPAVEPSMAEPAVAEPSVAEPLVAEAPVVEPSAAEPVVAAAPAEGLPTQEPRAPEPAEAIEEEREPEFAASSRRASTAPLREPQITVLPPRAPVPALPAMMSREVTLGDAARALRGALPSVLTMTDGRQLRRAVAVGAATSVVAAAFAIRARRR